MSAPRFDAVQEIEGWFYWEDALVFEAIDTIQSNHHICGDLLEIGVFHGKSAAFLGSLLRPGEQLYVCDLFETAAVGNDNQAENAQWYPRLKQETFERCYLQVHRRLPKILTCRSSQVKRVGKLTRTFRFIHIDGSHLYHIVRQDIRTASQLLKKGGLVAIDDYRSAHTPGVAAAAWEAILSRLITPLCVTAQKLYATVGDRNGTWLKPLKTWSLEQTDPRVAVDRVRGQQILRLVAKKMTYPQHVRKHRPSITD